MEIASKAFMGVSIRNPFYCKKENILNAIDVAKDFDEFLVFAVDYPYRLSLMAFTSLDAEAALQKALNEGERLRNFLAKVSRPYSNVKISSWRDLENSTYRKFLEEMKYLDAADELFSKLVEGEFTSLVARNAGNDEVKRSLCRNFVIEEFALFSSLVFGGYATRISKYPRSKSLDYFLGQKGINVNHVQL